MVLQTNKRLVLSDITKNTGEEIPLIIRLLENPKSLILFPGQVYLSDHDQIHLYLQRGITPIDEAYVVGFTMGLDWYCNKQHLLIFRFISKQFYPYPYTISDSMWNEFIQGYDKGRCLLQSKYVLPDFLQDIIDSFYNRKKEYYSKVLQLGVLTILILGTTINLII